MAWQKINTYFRLYLIEIYFLCCFLKGFYRVKYSLESKITYRRIYHVQNTSYRIVCVVVPPTLMCFCGEEEGLWETWRNMEKRKGSPGGNFWTELNSEHTDKYFFFYQHFFTLFIVDKKKSKGYNVMEEGIAQTLLYMYIRKSVKLSMCHSKGCFTTSLPKLKLLLFMEGMLRLLCWQNIVK